MSPARGEGRALLFVLAYPPACATLSAVVTSASACRIEAMRTAATEGKGAVSLVGRLIDAASIRMAENLLAKLEQIEARQTMLDVVKPAATA